MSVDILGQRTQQVDSTSREGESVLNAIWFGLRRETIFSIHLLLLQKFFAIQIESNTIEFIRMLQYMRLKITYRLLTMTLRGSNDLENYEVVAKNRSTLLTSYVFRMSSIDGVATSEKLLSKDINIKHLLSSTLRGGSAVNFMDTAATSAVSGWRAAIANCCAIFTLPCAWEARLCAACIEIKFQTIVCWWWLTIIRMGISDNKKEPHCEMPQP